jgi:hypothetical protein
VRQIVSYLRALTGKQGRSGLGIEAQREAITRFAAAEGCELLGEFIEVGNERWLQHRPPLAPKDRGAVMTEPAKTVAHLTARANRLPTARRSVYGPQRSSHTLPVAGRTVARRAGLAVQRRTAAGSP